jgi:serine O-acetyltransferase
MDPTEKSQRALESIIDAVAESYGEGRAIDSLESTALPNERRIVEALHCLEHIAYMGYYSTQALTKVNLRQHIGEHVYRASEILTNQIARAISYQRHGSGAPGPAELAYGAEIVNEVFAELPRLRNALADDVRAAYDGDPSAKSVEEIIFSYPGIKAITVYRIAHELYLRNVPMLPRIMTEYAHAITGIDIHPGARIGGHFFIDHGTGVVIGETTVIGEHVKLYQGVTLGALSLPRNAVGEVIREAKRHPTIEDEVTIYAGATILGGKTVIGKGSVIGANTWVIRSVPPHTRVSIVPAEQEDGARQRFDSISAGVGKHSS